MLTRCSNCQAEFEINDRLVHENDAEVRCGECHTLFDARKNLVDRYSGMPYQLQEDQASAPPVAVAGGYDEQPGELVESRHPPVPAAPVQEFDRTAAVTGIETAYTETAIDSGTQDSPVRPHSEPTEAGAGYAYHSDLELPPYDGPANYQTGASDAHSGTVRADELPSGSIDDSTESSAHSSALGSRKSPLQLLGPTLLVSLLGLALLIYAWRDEIARLPLHPILISGFCQLTGCQPPLTRDLTQLQLIQKKIYSHPSVEGALVVSVDVVNNAEFAQEYPSLSVVMADTDGVSVAERSFKPNEYLADAFSGKMLQPSKPVRIHLELMDPGADARTFELKFE